MSQYHGDTNVSNKGTDLFLLLLLFLLQPLHLLKAWWELITDPSQRLFSINNFGTGEWLTVKDNSTISAKRESCASECSNDVSSPGFSETNGSVSLFLKPIYGRWKVITQWPWASLASPSFAELVAHLPWLICFASPVTVAGLNLPVGR